MAQDDYDKRIDNMTVEQVEMEIHRALENAVRPDQIRNMPIGKIEEAHRAALRGLGFFPLPKIKCKLVCTATYPDFKVECRLECEFGF